MDQELQELQPPSFTLYPLTTQDLKTCYESQKYKLICTLNGPYYDRKLSQLTPIFNVSISCSNIKHNNITNDHLVRLQHKLQEVMQTVMLPRKYQRMVFDLAFEIIQTHPHNPPSFLLSPLINLLSYTCALRCLETIASFSCTAAILRQQKVFWQYDSTENRETDRTLVLCTDGRDRKALTIQFNGQFGYLQFQKLTGVAEQTNLQLLRFQAQKVNQVYDLFHQ